VPHRALHYLPFQALHDGESYLIERREVSFAPSAVVLQQCLERPKHEFSSALLMGVADEQIPRVEEELQALDHVFAEVKRTLMCFTSRVTRSFDRTIHYFRTSS